MEIPQNDAGIRQPVFTDALSRAVTGGATEIDIWLHAGQGIAGIVVPPEVVQGFRDSGARLEIRGFRE